MKTTGDLIMNIDELAEMMRAKAKRDECGDWRIFGKRGDITEDKGGFSIWFRFNTAAPMARCHDAVKEFCERRQNGDTEGAYFLPANEVSGYTVSILVPLLKIRQKKQLSSETLAKLTERMRGISAKRLVGSSKTVEKTRNVPQS